MAAMSIWGWLAAALAGFITGVAVTAVVMWFGRDRIRARLPGAAEAARTRRRLPSGSARGYRAVRRRLPPGPVAARFPGNSRRPSGRGRVP